MRYCCCSVSGALVVGDEGVARTINNYVSTTRAIKPGRLKTIEGCLAGPACTAIHADNKFSSIIAPGLPLPRAVDGVRAATSPARRWRRYCHRFLPPAGSREGRFRLGWRGQPLPRRLCAQAQRARAVCRRALLGTAPVSFPVASALTSRVSPTLVGSLTYERRSYYGGE